MLSVPHKVYSVNVRQRVLRKTQTERKPQNGYLFQKEAITREVVQPIEAGDVTDAYEAYGVDAIADRVVGDYEDGFSCTVDESEFWAIIEAHAK